MGIATDSLRLDELSATTLDFFSCSYYYPELVRLTQHFRGAVYLYVISYGRYVARRRLVDTANLFVAVQVVQPSPLATHYPLTCGAWMQIVRCH